MRAALLLITLVVFLASGGQAQAAQWPIAELAKLVDPSGEETIESISRPERAAEFIAAPRGLSAGYTRDVHWLRLRLDAPETGLLLLEIQPPYLDDVQLYLPDGSGGFHRRQTGDRYLFGTRDIPTRGFVFRVAFPSPAAQTLYLRVETTSTSLVLPRVFLPAEYAATQTTEYLLLGLFYGLMLAMLLFNLWHGYWRHDPEHRAFLIYISIVLAFMFAINGFLAQYLFPDAPEIAHHGLSLLVILSLGAAAHFHRLILAINRETPFLNAYFLGMIGLSTLSLPALWAGYFTEAAHLLTLAALLIPILGLLRTASLWRQGRTGSSFIALGYALSLISYLVNVLSIQGVLPGGHWQLYSFQGGALLALISFNYALYMRLRDIHKQRDAALEEARQTRIAHQAEKLSRERQGALLAMLTHELKTPLAVIRLALDRLTGDSGVRHHAARAISDINSVIDRCRYADRLDQGEIHGERQPCQLSEILDECLMQSHQAARFRCQFQAGIPPLISDSALLRTICSNLMDNALKYSAARSLIEISLQTQPHPNGSPGLALAIANAPGQAGAPDPARVFQRYHREPAAYAQTGSGLGLYLVRELALQLGGEIAYHPPQADGPIRFILWLPLESR